MWLSRAEDLRRPVAAGLEEHLARHDLEQITFAEGLFGPAHKLGVFAGTVIPHGDCLWAKDEVLHHAAAIQPHCRLAVRLELVTHLEGAFGVMVHDQNVVG